MKRMKSITVAFKSMVNGTIFLCNGAKSMKEAKLIEDGFRYKIQ